MRSNLAPAGSNMNDASYPFRGEYRLDKKMNHGHGGVSKALPTNLQLRISGHNLRLEGVETTKNQDLLCELAVGNLKPRSVIFPHGHQPFLVPADGKDYQLTATVVGPQAKHHCRLTLSSGAELYLRVAVHPRCEPFVVEADGVELRPVEGMISIPYGTQICHMRPERFGPLPVENIAFDASYHSLDYPLIHCHATGENFRLFPDSSQVVTVPHNKQGGFSVRLPRQEAPGPAPPAIRTADVDVKILRDGRQTALSVTAYGFQIELSSDTGHIASGHNQATLLVDPKRQVVCGITVSDPATLARVLRQSIVVPVLDSPYAALLRVDDQQGPERHLYTNPDASVSIDGSAPVAAAGRGIPVDATSPHTITVVQPNADGTTSMAQVNFGAKPRGVDPNKWVEDLANALGDGSKSPDSILAALGDVHPNTPAGDKVVNFIRSQLSKVPPQIEAQLKGGAWNNIRCPGYGIAAGYGGNAPCVIPPGGSIQCHPTLPVQVMALDAKNGSLAASTVLGTPATEPSDDEVLVQRMLDATNTAGGDPDTLANLLLGIPTSSQRGQRLLPALSSALRRPSPTPSTPHNIALQCNVEKDAGVKIAYQLDGSPSLDLPFNIATSFSSLSKLLTLKVKRGVSAFLDHLINAFRRGSPPPLSERWANTPTGTAQEDEFLQILLSILRDYEDLLNRQRPTTSTPVPLAAIRFACLPGILSDIRCEGHQLFATVDGLPPIAIAQGGQVPQGVPFTEGTQHSVHLMARDSLGNLRGEAIVAVHGPSKQAPQGVPYVDVALSRGPADQTILRVTCPPAYRVTAEVDHVRQDGPQSNQAVVAFDSRKPHVIAVSVVDTSGATLFQEKMDFPALSATSVPWGLAFERNSVSLTSPSALENPVLVSIDLSAEKPYDGPIPLSHDVPHQVQFRTAANARSLQPDLSLKFPYYVDPDDVLESSNILQHGAGGDGLRVNQQLMALHDRTKSGILKKLLSEIMRRLREWEEMHSKRTVTTTTPQSTVFFRLRGDDERFSSMPSKR